MIQSLMMGICSSLELCYGKHLDLMAKIPFTFCVDATRSQVVSLI